jgi:hypothetical protein
MPMNAAAVRQARATVPIMIVSPDYILGSWPFRPIMRMFCER